MTSPPAESAAPRGARPTRRYESPLRQERAAQTRERIIAAGSDLVRELSSWDWRELTIRAVAQRAGVHQRTVYRHFPSEQDLRAAVVQRLEQEAGVIVEGLQLADVPEQVAKLFGYVSAFASSNAHQPDASLLAVDRRRKDSLLAAVEAAASDWTDDDRRLATAMIDVLWSVSTYRGLVGGWQLEPEEAVRGVNWLVGLVSAAIAGGRPPGSQ